MPLISMWLENKAQLQLQVKHRALRTVVVILLVCNTSTIYDELEEASTSPLSFTDAHAHLP